MQKTQIIIFTGKSQSGKDYGCNYVQQTLGDIMIPHERESDCYSNGGPKAKIYTFAYALKNFVRDVFGVPHEQVWGTNEQKDMLTHLKWENLPTTHAYIEQLKATMSNKHDVYMTGREVLQVWGTDICRHFYGDCWAFSTLAQIYKENPAYALISDARFPNELDIMKLTGVCEKFRDKISVEPIVIRLLRNPLNKKHKSETALDNYNFSTFKNHYLINNVNMTIDEKNMHINAILIQQNLLKQEIEN